MIRRFVKILLLVAFISLPVQAEAWTNRGNICFSSLLTSEVMLTSCSEKNRHIIQIKFTQDSIENLKSIRLLHDKKRFDVKLEPVWEFKRSKFVTYYFFTMPEGFVQDISTGSEFELEIERDDNGKELRLSTSQKESLRLIASIS